MTGISSASSPPSPGSRPVETVVGGASALVVLGLIGFLTWQAIFVAPTLPDLSVSADPPGAGSSDRHVRFTVINRGGKTAGGVTVSAVAREGGPPMQKRSVTLDFVPAGSRVHGGFLLDDASGPVQLIVEGYVDP